VGGIVIMNIMLAVVTERTREIGIRKSLGARSRDILSQYMVESAVLAGVGGLAGVAAAWVVAILVRSFSSVPMALPWSSVLLGVGLSATVGLFFGIYPAQMPRYSMPLDGLRFVLHAPAPNDPAAQRRAPGAVGPDLVTVAEFQLSDPVAESHGHKVEPIPAGADQYRRQQWKDRTNDPRNGPSFLLRFRRSMPMVTPNTVPDLWLRSVSNGRCAPITATIMSTKPSAKRLTLSSAAR